VVGIRLRHRPPNPRTPGALHADLALRIKRREIRDAAMRN
jgi:hypothetical protein